jgi:hypothetical protein
MPTIELLYFSECPNYRQALTTMQAILAASGVTSPIHLVAVETQAEAERQGFYGSPTIRIDGVDIVPPEPTARPALACRVYRTAQGALGPLPPHDVLVAAAEQVAHRSAGGHGDEDPRGDCDGEGDA